MKNVCMLFLISVVISIASCQSSSNSSPEKIALDFTRLFFQQLAHSRNSDFTKYPLELEAEGKFFSEALIPFKKGICTQQVYNEIYNFYKKPIPPAFQYSESFYASEDYKIIETFVEGPIIKYAVAAMKWSENAWGRDSGVLSGLTVNVIIAGKTPSVSGFCLIQNINNPN